MDEYIEHIQPVDPRVHASLANYGVFLPCWKILDPAEFDKSPVVGDWTDRKDINRRWGAACVWDIDQAHAGLLAFLRPRTEGAFQMEELAPVKRLRSHVRRAAQLHFLFRGAPGGRIFDHMWGAQSQAVFLLGRGKRLLGANEAAHEILRSGEIFAAAWGELIAREPRLAATLDHALAAARQFDLTIHPRSVTFAWPFKDGRTALHAEAMALPGLAAETGVGERVELLLFARTLLRQRKAPPHVTNLLSGLPK
jgi:PAS domain-containing protein